MGSRIQWLFACTAVLAAILAGAPAVARAAVDETINFQPALSLVPAGYSVDSGAAYSDVAGRGWVREDSLDAASHVPLDVSPNARERNAVLDQRLDTFIHMQFPSTVSSSTAVRTPAAWELAVPSGDYTVTVAVGDAGTAIDSTHRINVEGQAAILAFKPTASTKFSTATRTVTVSDGRLTIDARGGTNTKIDYVDVHDADTVAPAAPANVKATPGDSQVALAWSPNSESDLAGYDIHRGTSLPVSTSGTPLNGSTPITAASYTDRNVTNGTTYHYVFSAVDRSGNRATASPVSATPTAGTPPPATNRKINFQPASAPVPAGYTADSGAAYSDATGQGWVREDSLDAASHVPLDVSPNARDRNIAGDQRLDTLIHMQFPSSTSSSTAVRVPAAWEIAVPTGDYNVTVSVGDAAANFDSTHRINVEGQVAVNNFVPASAERFRSATTTVRVSDGRLTIDARGGTNTKIDYVDVNTADTTPPAAPTNVTATAGDARVTLGWNANTEADLAGYDVYRGTSLPVSTSGTPLNGTFPLTTNSYTDTTVVNGRTYQYVVVAEDASGNRASADPVSATPQGAVTFDRKINFQPAGASVPAGYTADTGAAYSSAVGQGWIREDSLDEAGHVPLDVSPNARDRNISSDQRLDTFIHMQFPTTLSSSTAVKAPAAWEIAVAPGGYTVTVAVGDASAVFDSFHRISVEGQVIISGFTPTTNDRFATATRTVNVADGRLTIDARGGTNTKIDYVTIVSDTADQRPSVTSVRPSNGATGVLRDTSVTAEVDLPNVGAGIDPATLTASTVRLVRASDGAPVSANRNTTGGGDAIILQPTAPLASNTRYSFEVTSGLRDLSGAPFLPFDSSFTTGTGTSGGGGTIDAQFEKVTLSTAQGDGFTSVTMGPDNRLYAGTFDGKIYRFPVNADGTTGTPTVITSLQTAEGGPRTLLGMAFDPAATASNPILWISHNEDAVNNATDWTGKIARLSGTNLGTVQDYVVGLPRSVRDHETNSLAFGPDGALYVTQGSNSATGAADSQWGFREEHALSAAVLRINIGAISSAPVNVKTDDGGTYNPFAAGAPVTLYASGVRNAFDLVWHSNGQLYVPTNGSVAGGSTPGTPSPLPTSCSKRIDAGRTGPTPGRRCPASPP